MFELPKSWRARLDHAFGVEPEGAGAELPEPLERLARALVERGIETPALIFLESVVPLSFLGSQALLAAWPLVRMVSGAEDVRVVAEALEDRGTVRRLAGRVEELAAARSG